MGVKADMEVPRLESGLGRVSIREQNRKRSYLTSPFLRWSMSMCIPSAGEISAVEAEVWRFRAQVWKLPSLSIPVAIAVVRA